MIGAWGVGVKSEAVMQSRWTGRALLSFARTFMSKPFEDATAGIHALEDARRDGLLRLSFIQPPIITNGVKTDTYESGSEDNDIAQRMGNFDTISRHDLADLTIRLVEQAGEGQELPNYVLARNP